MDANSTQFAEIDRRLLAVPDKLITAQRCLREVSHRDTLVPAESTRPIAEACDLMHSVLGEVVQAARDLAELSGVDRGAGSFQRVRVDNYYRQKP